MCGIVGTTGAEAGNIERAIASLAHRGPDQKGTFADLQLALGHCRLSVIDLSEGGKQPMTDAAGNVAIAYNGEIYNYRELKAALQAAGSQFKTETDTEVILEGYAREGVSFLNKLRGMWALAIYDKREGQVILSRDRFGIKPLYYTTLGGGLEFVSEMKAFKYLDVPLRPNTEEFYTFFNLGYFVAPATCYEGVFMLQPGEILTYYISTKDLSFEQLKSVKNTIHEQVTDEREAVDMLEETLLDSIRAHYVADVPVGILFSGGNDSTLIAALSRAAGYNPQAYHLAIEGSSDTKYATHIAKHLNLESEFISMGAQELATQYEEVWNILDTPFADISIIPTSLIYKKIAGRSKVVLSGEGGDEWFGGYLRHHRLASLKHVLATGSSLNSLNKLYGTSSAALAVGNPLLRRLYNYYLNSRGDVIGAYLAETKIINYPIGQEKLRSKLLSLYENAGEQVPANLFFDQRLYLPNDLLFKNDLASMASSIEARVPFIDVEVLREVQNISSHLRLSPKYKGKYLLKKVLERYVPQELVHRDKRGFGLSFTTYHVPQFREDVRRATAFHAAHADVFGLAAHASLLDERHTDVFIKKYPRFAFGIVSNWKVFENL